MQSGDFDDGLLCESHEAALHASDDYAIRLVRGWRKAAVSPLPDLLIVAGIDHSKLLRFVASVIWRHGASSRFSKVDLGPFELPLRRYVFDLEGDSFCPEVFVHTLHDDRFSLGLLDSMMLPVSRGELVGRRAWGFTVHGLHFLMKTDSRPLSLLDRTLLIGEASDLFVVSKPLRGSPEEKNLKDILSNMLEAPKR